MEKRILCVDMDAFFASVEQATRPYLKKVPMAVAGQGERTVILSASYIARAKGVKTGQTASEARRICPSLQIIPASNKKYSYISSKIAEFLKTISPTAIMYSVDEAFIDISDLEEDSKTVAYRIKSWLKVKLGLTGSIGVGSSYILAKMASDARKPDGYYEVKKDEGIRFIDGFKLNSIWGIGKRTTAKLNSLGLFSPSDVRSFGKDALMNIMGLNGEAIYLSCCGIDKRHTVRHEDDACKSISHSVTAQKDIYTPSEAMAYLLQLSEMVCARARQKGYSGKTVALILRDTDMKTRSFRKTIGFYTSATHHIYPVIKHMFFEHNTPFFPLRLLGVALCELQKSGPVVNNLEDFIMGNEDRYINLYKAIDKINAEYTDGIIRASALKIDYRRPRVISPNFDATLIYE